MPALDIQSITKRYGDTVVVDNVSLSIASGEFISLLGPSGCGKTTILRMVAGLLDPSSGTIAIGGQDVTRVPVNRRNVGLVFQSYALFPHFTVFENVAFGLRRQGIKGTDLAGRVKDALTRIRMDSFGDRYPRELSGGQQQRVALARSIAPRPSILLFDEPLSNLDAQLRDEMQIELKRLQRELELTSLFVTHDQHEAMSLSDRICLLAGGKTQQFGTPEEIYFKPANGFVAGFIGSPNNLSGTIRPSQGTHGIVEVDPKLVFKSARSDFQPGSRVGVTIRQEDIELHAGSAPQGDTGACTIPGRIALRIFSGSTIQFLVSLGQNTEIVARIPSTDRRSELTVGEPVMIGVDPGKIFLSPEGGIK